MLTTNSILAYTKQDGNPAGIKYRSGDSSSRDMQINKALKQIEVGTAKLPLLPLGIFSADEDGSVRSLGEKLVVTLDGQLWTPNIISVLLNQNTAAGQQAIFTIQHNGQSAVLLNAATQETRLVHTDGQPLQITASSIVTGAMGAATAGTSAGQAYVLSSNANTTVEGSLQSVCVRKEFNYSGAPVVAEWAGAIVLAGTIWNFSGTQQGVNDSIRAKLVNVQLGMEPFTIDGQTLSQNIQRQQNFCSSPLKLYQPGEPRASVMNNPVIRNGTDNVFSPFTQVSFGFDTRTDVTTPDIYAIRTLMDATDVTLTTSHPLSFTVDPNASYQVVYQISPGAPIVTSQPATLSNDAAYAGHLRIRLVAYVSVLVRGPLPTFCAQTETIDTRKNVYTMSVYYSPLN